MLERTAAGLETGHLHRVLPRSTRPQAARHLRQPRASFSQSHGPASVARRPEPHGSRKDGASQGHDNPSPLLDFLYPKRTHPLLRRQSFPSLPLRSRSPWPACSAAQRRYESTDSSNRPSGQPSTAEPEDGAPAEAEEQTGRKFDHTKWQDTGATLRPKRTYSVEEEDDDLLYGNGDQRRTADAVEQAESMLDAAWSRTRDIETRLPERSRARPNPYRSYGHMDYEDSLVDLEMEKELKMSLKAQILEEEEMDRDLEEQGELIPVSEVTETGPERSDSAGESADQGEEPVAQQAEKASSRFTRPSEPLYKLPKGERPDPPKEDAPGDESEAHVKRRSRFAEPEQPTGPLQEEEAVLDEVAEPAEAEEAEEPQRPLTIYEMLEDVQGAHYHAVYDAHVRLDEEERDRMRPQVIAYLAKSRSVVEAGRVKALFRQTSVDDWTGEMLSAVVLVFLRTSERTQAFDAFRTGLRKFGLTGGFEYLLIDSVNKHQWHVALDVWLVYCKDLAERTPGRVPDAAMLKPFTSLDSLGGLYFLFERYLAAAERKVERFLDDKPVSKQALAVFRRAFAKAALDSSCPPQQARVILDWWYNQRFYEKYIWDTTNRWSQKQISSDTARELIPIYEDLRAMPAVKISSSALSCMFRVCYPHNGQTLEQLHQDWVQMHGDLDSWGYRRFMKFYSHRGDAERVKTLWEKYIKLYPGELTHAQSFNSIMNAYAQSGDTDGAEAELQRMQEQYHIAPDISLMNAKLKCYMRAGDYKATLACFKDILTNFKPDAYTYAHMMAMCAKKGDTDQTIDFFNEAQDKRVPITKEMVLALVVAYCGNDQIGAAEELTRRLAGANITSAAIWNQLVVHHGKKARLDKCYKILDEMKERGIEWDRDTIDNLLQALAQVKQTGPAYQVLKTATQEQQSIVQPEHYVTVMVGAARNRDVASADGVYELLMKAGIPVPFNAMVAYTDLMLERKSKAKRTATLPRQMVDSLRVLVNDVEKMDIQKRRQLTRRVPWCIQLLIEFRDFDAIEEVVTLYTQLFPEYKNGNLPPDIIASLMQGYQRDENYDRVIALWDESWPRLLSERVQPSGEGIYPAHEYDMDRLVYRLADAYRSLNSTKPLAAAIEQVHKAGFKLTTHTWDRVIGAFALTGNWKIGVRWCETVLMAGWAGWTRRLTSRERRARQNPRVLWPQRRTILALREGWIADRQLAAWSGPIARALVNLDIDYPRTVNAFRDSLEPEVAGGPWIMTRKTSMEQLLKPLPLHELKVMDRELRRFLDDEDEVTQRTKSPFRVLSERDDRLRSLSRGEMMRLKGLLDRVLPAETVEVSEVVNEDEKVAASTGDSASG